jgi:L-asparaginase
MQILVVFTGGTIGSTVNESSIDVAPSHTKLLLKQFQHKHGCDIEFAVTEPLSILSENATPEDWDRIVRSIRGFDTSQISGIVVTHGTDTLPFASAALSFALNDIPVPVVVVASNLPLSDPEANGPANFEAAIELIEKDPGRGVFVTYRNPDGRLFVHYGSRLAPATPLDHFFRSVGQSEFGEFDGDKLEIFGAHRSTTRTPHNARLSHSSFAHGSGRILLVEPYPGLNYAQFNLDGVETVVHGLYHSGTACSRPGRIDFGLSRLVQRCAESSIPIFLAPWPDSKSLYESSRSIIEDDAVTVVAMSTISTYVKVHLGIGAGLSDEELRHFMTNEEIANEFLSPIQLSAEQSASEYGRSADVG